MDTSQEDDSASNDASEASEASVTTADSSWCDPQLPDDVPVISPQAQNVTDVLLSEVTAPLVTISISMFHLSRTRLLLACTVLSGRLSFW